MIRSCYEKPDGSRAEVSFIQHIVQEPDHRFSLNQTCEAADEEGLGRICVKKLSPARGPRGKPRQPKNSRDVPRAEARVLVSNALRGPFAGKNTDLDAGHFERMPKWTIGKQDNGRSFTKMTRDGKQV